ncbi:dATP/dGTP diphosphohydrolase domain-containing protein [Bradyrhizobium liaoningense]
MAKHPKFDHAPAASSRQRLIDADSATRKTFPMARGLLDYFPDALAAVAQHSFIANQKHNPGEEMHHARGKSTDHADCILRHLVGRGGFDGNLRESTALAWRALALLQEELERDLGLPPPRAARAPDHAPKS